MPSHVAVEVSRRAEKSLRAVPQTFLARIRDAIRELAADPLAGKKLKGEFAGLRSYRLASCRIVYRFSPCLVEIVDVDDRKDVYR